MVRLPAIHLVAPLALLGMVLSSQALAEVRVRSSVSATETYSDNPQLSADGSEGQFISSVTPTLNAIINSPRVQMSANLSANLYAYSGNTQNTNSASVQLSAGGKASLIQDLFYVDASASRSRQSISAFGQQSPNDYSSANSTTISSWRISPYLVQRFGNFASGQLRYTRDWVQSGNGQLGKSHGDSASLALNSGPAFTTFGWDLQASHQSVGDAIAGESNTDNAVATLRYRAKSTLSLYVNGGYDRYSYEGLGGTSGGKSFAGGFTWTPSQRTSIDASIGRRYFGKTYSLDAKVRSRRTLWNVAYHDDITTARAQFLRPGSIDTASLLDSSFAAAFPDPVERLQAIRAYLAATGLPTSIANNINYFSNRLLLQKQLQASFVLNGAKSSLIASVSNTRRTALSPEGVDAPLTSDLALGGLNDNTRQTGASVAFNYRLSSRTSTTASTSKSRSLSTTTGITQTQTNVNLTVNHQFARKLQGNVNLRHSRGDAFSVFGGGYRENAVSASLTYQL
jgi:uncharacterized protein (PEP-CTERM system associated)